MKPFVYERISGFGAHFLWHLVSCFQFDLVVFFWIMPLKVVYIILSLYLCNKFILWEKES
ncbi:hypothetical protein HMPREF0971_00421 [Segatella oris F0302]|uniref:Uncharacterized protein n=1 Tax=Segatella oris F0302 TaxID=649760 RepID=D1QN85_9BACT|nr:hypothetical protein HMPREF0971_00421 [Segatella oris F0302]